MTSINCALIIHYVSSIKLTLYFSPRNSTFLNIIINSGRLTFATPTFLMISLNNFLTIRSFFALSTELSPRYVLKVSMRKFDTRRDFYLVLWMRNSSMNYCLKDDYRNCYINNILEGVDQCWKNSSLIDSKSHTVIRQFFYLNCMQNVNPNMYLNIALTN